MPPETMEMFAKFLRWGIWCVLAVFATSAMAAVGLLAWEHRRSEPLGDNTRWLMRICLCSCLLSGLPTFLYLIFYNR